ncbi:hypothetical protein V6N11_046655 [Hibiscus sabdariffa]|uniref:Uncharacterized protein n=1 Tax=Hibiscus sabdariffa TaxID=183260 RepID=A0ABR2P346_9ROSI
MLFACENSRQSELSSERLTVGVGNSGPESVNEGRGFAVDTRFSNPTPSVFVTRTYPSRVKAVLAGVVASVGATGHEEAEDRKRRFAMLGVTHHCLRLSCVVMPAGCN